MKTINSLSGGKTSSYLAVKYPADFNIFSLVTIKDFKCKPKDKSIINYVSNKINKDFIATAESDLTLYVIRDLEQIIGKEIIWVCSDYFENIIEKKKALPNIMKRFCTTELKMQPIGDWWLNNINDKIKMRVGFRYDEKERAEKFSNEIKLKIGKHLNGNNKWKTFEWRIGDFPLIDNKITNYHIKKWAESTSLIFPKDSNCVGCFWKPIQQLRKNWIDEPEKMQWFSDQEKKYTWKKEMNYYQIKKIGLQSDFIFGTGTGCQSGYCTD